MLESSHANSLLALGACRWTVLVQSIELLLSADAPSPNLDNAQDGKRGGQGDGAKTVYIVNHPVWC